MHQNTHNLQIYAHFFKTFRPMWKMSIICNLLQIYAEKNNFGSKKIKYFKYMWKQCNFFRSMHSTTMKYQTYVRFFKSIPGPGEHHYVQIFVQKIVISITQFKVKCTLVNRYQYTLGKQIQNRCICIKIRREMTIPSLTIR